MWNHNHQTIGIKFFGGEIKKSPLCSLYISGYLDFKKHPTLVLGCSLWAWAESPLCLQEATEAVSAYRRGADKYRIRTKASSRVHKTWALLQFERQRAPQINLLAQFGGESAFNQFQHVKKLQTSAYMLKHLENGLMMFTTEMNCTITVSLIYIKNYSRQMHLHKIYLFILIYCNLHNLSMPTAICRQPLGK